MHKLKNGVKALQGKGFSLLGHFREEMNMIRACQNRVHEFVRENPFEDEAEEIAYHKLLYPELRALHIFSAEKYLLNKDRPAAAVADIRAYYGGQLQLIFAYIRRYEFLYQYYRLEADELDGIYFTAKGNRGSVLLPVLAEPDAGHTTEAGYLFARFMSYEMLFAYVADRLRTDDARPFRWTGESLNLVELLHGIHLTGQLNNGEVGIVELFKGMGEFLGVELGIPKKGLDGLMKRKKLSRTHYTDRVRDSLVKRMDEEDDWDREKRLKNKPGF